MLSDKELMKHDTTGYVLRAKNMRYHSWFIAALGEGMFCLYDGSRDLHAIGTAEELREAFSDIPTEPQPRKMAVRNEYLLPPTLLEELDIIIDL